MVFTFARVTAVTTMRVEDYFEHGKCAWLRLHEKGGKRHEVPCHHNLTEYLDAWMEAAKLAGDKKGPLFRAIRKENKLTENAMAREDILAMIKRRAAGAALPYSTCVLHEVFEYIELFYKRQRRHSALGYLSPHEFEHQASRHALKPVLRLPATRLLDAGNIAGLRSAHARAGEDLIKFNQSRSP
jgi:integrase